ncbi:variable surface protein [Plasmodium gonderi]|uniref:Variable surface protein n=1 Tax=Plasmodium gonderi TaxID=77519 RepID=A0A1Y1JRC7_PLAGO|nr:variable surface protein [Plasmodium gonderi]GAW84045.1 variable surface protein [Plasmodium gonderi]
MAKSIYNVLKKFPKCKEKMDECVKNSNLGLGSFGESICKNHENADLLRNLIGVNDKLEKMCIAAMEYLGSVNSGSLYEAGCEYFYYWIYHDLLGSEKNRINDIQSVYNLLIEIFTKIGFSLERLCKVDESIKIGDFHKIIKVYDAYNKIVFDSSSNNDILFNIVVDMMYEHNEQIESLNIQINNPIITTPCQRNIAPPIMITILVALLICIFIFVLLKFSGCSLWIRRAIAWKKNHSDRLGDESNMFEIPEISSSFIRDNKYNISYNYP